MSERPADVVIRNAKVHTVDDARPSAGALAIVDGTIAWVGADQDAAGYAGPGTVEIDGAGHTVMPGVIDSHNHVRLGDDPEAIDLHGVRTTRAVHDRISSWLAVHPDAEWVEGEGVAYEAAEGGALRDLFDESVTGGRPAFATTYDVHNAILNRTALDRFGITRGVDRVLFGNVRKDSAGEPTGVIHDFAVMGLERSGQAALAAVVPAFSDDRRYQRLCNSLDLAIGFGITTVVEPQNSVDDLPLFERARREGRLRSRLVAALFQPPGTSDEDLDAFAEASTRFDDDRLRAGPIKLYIDDVAEAHTAAFFQPYASDPSTNGALFYEPEVFAELIAKLDAREFQTFTHAIGDRGIRTVLDAIEHAQQVNGRSDARHQLVHVECPDPADVPRFAGLGVVPCMQPRHFAPDVALQWREDVGPEREGWAAPWRSLARSGAVLAFSSDWNVAEMDPMVGLYTAVARADLSGHDAWNTGETVDLATAIGAYTMGGAYANHVEDRRGSITPGKQADVIVLSEDVFAFEDDPAALLETKVNVAIVDGRVEHDRSNAH
jgi:predicted amidohydrolase YtcJ